jgi:histidine ammonia-lyase
MNLDGNSLSLETFREIVEKRVKIEIDAKTRQKLQRSRAVVDRIIESGKVEYGINTGFGILCNVTISPEKLHQLQENLIRSHCVGVGEAHTETESRALLLLRANCLAKGFSGVRPELVDFLVEMLNRQVHPVIPSKGSVGASGDLAPLSHLAAVVIGEGEAFFGGQRMTGAEALNKAGLTPMKLAPKEGLSLINGTQQMTALGALYLIQAEELVDLADLICSTTLDGVLGSPRAYADWLQKTRPFPGQMASARRLRTFMQDSEIVESHADCGRVQDPYSLRCAPQVHGAVRDLFFFVRNILSIELNAVTDNPLVNADTGEILSNGNFHGQPVAFALDILGMGLSELGSISERRLVKLLDPLFSELPSFLVAEEGLNSGFMAAQYTAASAVSENKLFTHPASTDSIPTCNEKEDHVSMGPIGARKAKVILENSQTILAIEALAACQALDFRKPLQPGLGPRFLHKCIREHIPTLERDRYLHKDIEFVTSLIRSGQLHQRLNQESDLL